MAQELDHQDWTTVTLRRRPTAKEAQAKGTAEARDVDRGEKARLSKLDTMDARRFRRSGFNLSPSRHSFVNVLS